MEINFKTLANPTITKAVKYEKRPITLGERTNLWGTEINITKAPSNIFNKIKERIRR